MHKLARDVYQGRGVFPKVGDKSRVCRSANTHTVQDVGGRVSPPGTTGSFVWHSHKRNSLGVVRYIPEFRYRAAVMGKYYCLFDENTPQAIAYENNLVSHSRPPDQSESSPRRGN